MKKSFVINLFLVLIMVFTANTVVNDAFVAKKEVVSLPKTIASKTTKTIPKNPDYTPTHSHKVEVLTTIKKITFLPVEKIAKVNLPAAVIVKKTLPTKKLSIKKNTKLSISFGEIEDQGKITVSKIKRTMASDFSFKLNDYSKVAEAKTRIKNQLNKTDRISTIASAPEKSRVKKTNINKDVISQKETTDELVFFDYSEDGKVITKEVVAESTSAQVDSVKIESPKVNGISTNSLGLNNQKKSAPKLQNLNLEDIQKDIKRKIKKGSPIKVAKSESNLMGDSSGEKTDYSNPDVRKSIAALIDDTKKDEENDYSCLDEKRLSTKNYTSEFKVSLNSINHTKDNFKPIHNFEIRFHDDEDDIIQDFGKGEIEIKNKLSTQMNIRRASLLASSHYPTVFDFVFEGLKADIAIPVFKKETFDNLINSLGLRGLGAHLLIELDEKTEDIEIAAENKYESKVYLDKNLKRVDRDTSDYSYILFVGVDPGNTIVNFLNIKNEISNKIIHLTEKEIYYDPNFYAEILDDKVELFKEGLLSKCKGLLSVDENEIKSWSFDSKIKKKSINRYSLGRMIYPVGTRKYMELSHLDESIFVGRWGQGPVVIPSEEYVRHALGNFEINGTECLVQVNLTKDLKNFSYNAQSKNGYVRTQAKFLDKDGSFYTDLSNDSKRIFVVGEEQGIINMKLEYTDGSSQYLQTFCSDNTYLVEQL
jgi:uncharacterized protein YuzE